VTAALDPAIKVVTFLVMVAVGTDLVAGDFRRVLRQGRAIVLPTVGQWLLLPAIAALLVAMIPLPEAARLALVLVAICPGGALSSAHVYIARADTALSVSLTAVSTVAALVTMPLLLLAGLAFLGEPRPRPDLLWGQAVVTLLGAVLVPLLLGMLLRRRWPGRVVGQAGRLRAAAAGGVGLLVVLAIADQGEAFFRTLPLAIPLGLVYSLLALGAGKIVARAAALGSAGRLAASVEFTCRNMAVYALVGVPVLGRPEVLASGVAFFLAQVGVSVAASAAWKRRREGTGLRTRTRNQEAR